MQYKSAFNHSCVIFFLAIFTLLFSYPSYSQISKPVTACDLTPEEISYYIEQIKLDNQPLIKVMADCKKANRNLFARVVDTNLDYFQFAADSIKDDEVFIGKFITINPQILKYISPRLADDDAFIFNMTRISPDAMKYASERLTDNKNFMTKMININPKNFTYASDRLQDDKEFTMLAIKKNGKMLRFASERLQDDKQIVIESIKSYNLSINFASPRLQKDRQIRKLSKKIDYSFLDNLDQFLKNNYGGFSVGPQGSRGYYIVNIAKLFSSKQIIYQPYLTKWERVYKNGVETDDLHLVSKNFQKVGWQEFFKRYPGLTKEIENIFISNNVDQNTIDNLSLVSFWQVSKSPQVVAFELYLLRKIDNKYLGSDVENVVALTAIAKKKDGFGGKKWEVNIAQAIFDANLKMDVTYKSGHKRYKIWDIYQSNKRDKNPKVLFKVEDQDGEYFDLFAKQINDRYASIYKGGGYSMEVNILD